ncbi:MAG: type II toxin-antitoxin system PemK/MazF family toxin [Desulfamplus sp.]|nr:type II toxin-antitoxin system PemK/MazF family toxin [Desulfamplus sp.]
MPITSKKQNRRIYPNEILLTPSSSGLTKDSIILCHQIRTLDKIRLTKKIGEIADNELQHQIIEGLCFQLAINC